MSVRCTRCGEELLGAVNRCWKCGQTFALRPEIDGRPPVRPDALAAPEQPLEAIVVEQDDSNVSPSLPVATVIAPTVQAVVLPPAAAAYSYSLPPAARRVPLSTADLIDARRASASAMGGTAGAFVLGTLGLAFGLFGFWGLAAAIPGLVMGIWGLYSPRRNLALAAMLLCCLAIGLSSYMGARLLYLQILKSRPAVLEDDGYQVTP